jgi:phosphohistidine phosphatase SixA
MNKYIGARPLIANGFIYCLFVILALAYTGYSHAQSSIYLLRHAEKVVKTGLENPPLTAIGKFRAENIAKQLSEIGIKHIYSTDYLRTMQTAQPLAAYLGLEIKTYDPRKLREFAEQLKQLQGATLVVGHSNTTPELTALLSDKTVKAISENEYDNLYQVIITKQGTTLNQFKSIPSYVNINKNNEN